MGAFGGMLKTIVIGAGVSAYKAGVEIKNKGEAFYEKSKLEALELEHAKTLEEVECLSKEERDEIIRKAKLMRQADLAKKLSKTAYVKDNLNAKKAKAEKEAKEQAVAELAKELLKHLKK